ncbi:MAG: hypothetical protein FP812_07370 [Desulfobacula sp.]|nr:hypothetical protein [Desulfobacula sp.]
MELLTNPWFIVFTGINIAALIYLAIKFRYKSKKEPLLFEKLRDAGIFPTLRIPPKSSDLEGGDPENCNPSNDNT